MHTQIPPDARIENLSFTDDLDLAACLLCDDQTPQLPENYISVFVEGKSRKYIFRFPPSPEVSKIKKSWKACVDQGPLCINGDPIGYIFSAFRYCDRLAGLIREGRGGSKPKDTTGNFWTVNTKAAAAALAVAKVHNLSDERLARMIYWQGDQAGFLIRGIEYIEAFQDPTAFCASRPPQDPLAIITAAFFFRMRLRDIVNSKPAQHVFREIDDNGKQKISFIAEPQ